MNKENNKREKNNRFNALAGILILINYALIIGLIPIARYYPEIRFVLEYEWEFWGNLVEFLYLVVFAGLHYLVYFDDYFIEEDLIEEFTAFKINAIIETIICIVAFVFLIYNYMIYRPWSQNSGGLYYVLLMLLGGFVIVMNIIKLIQAKR
ncbi:MAG: hypothetical protein IKC48_03535 [Clostridia bacterium]|nr:hypothetical protein [Clostridia bacterium]